MLHVSFFPVAEEIFQLWFLILVNPWPCLCPAGISGLESKNSFVPG